MGEVILALIFGYFFGGMRKQQAAPIAPEPPRPTDPDIPPIPRKAEPPRGAPIPPPPATPGYEQPPAAPEPGKVTPAPVPPSYKPPGGWAPYMTPWSISRAKFYLGQPSLLPTGSSIIETDPKGVSVQFRAESGKAHGDAKLRRAVTAWRKVA